MQVRLLGVTDVCDDLGNPVHCGGAKQRAVLAQLALAANTPMGIDHIAEGVWGEQVPARYRQNLQVYISTLRRALEPARPAGTPSRILNHREAYELICAPDEFDVAVFRAGRVAGEHSLTGGAPGSAARELEAALAEWRGDALADLRGMPFAGAEVTGLDAERLRTHELLLDARLALGAHDEVLLQLDALLAAHPEREHLWMQRALALFRSGRQVEALATVRKARDLLLDEHGLDPGPALQTLEAQLLAQDPALSGDTPPTVRVEPVPVPLTAAVGRSQLVAEVGALVRANRLVVLTGPGGVGKTRTALDVMQELGQSWVSFADEPDDSDIADVVAARLGEEDLSDAIGVETYTICLDNLEHIHAAGTQVMDLLLQHGNLRILATSRGALGVAGERLVAVARLDEDDAATLFHDRARAALPSWDAADNDGSVRELCRRLDGLPLAIELAAARVRLLDPQDLLDRLPSMNDLRGGAGPVRHSSLVETVRWSLALLQPADRAGIGALAVLDYPVDVRTATIAVAATRTDDGAAPADVERLVDLALLDPLETDAGRRIAMLNTVRAVVREDLVTDELQRRVLTTVGQSWAADPAWTSTTAAPPRRLTGLSEDLGLIRSVVRALVTSGLADRAAELVLSRRRGFIAIGRQDVALDLLRVVLAGDVAPPWRARAQVVAGSAVYNLRRTDDGLLAHVDDLAPDDHVYRVFGCCYRAVLAADAGAGDFGAGAAAQAIDAAVASGMPSLALMAYSAASWSATARTDPDEAVQHAEFGLAAAVRMADGPEIVNALADLARAELGGGHGGPARAAELAQDGLQRARRLGATLQVAEHAQLLGFALIRLGRQVEGARVLGDVLDVAAGNSDPSWALDLVGVSAAVAIHAGLVDEGRDLLRHARARSAATGIPDPIPALVAAAFDGGTVDPTAPAPAVPDALEVLVARTRRLVQTLGNVR